MIVVADTGPVNYLVLSGHISLIQELFRELIIPPAVQKELVHHRAPRKVSEWAQNLPAWARVRIPADSTRYPDLGQGEREAICLALELKADFLLIDETVGRKIAVANHLAVKGTLGILEEASLQGLVNLPNAIKKLRSTGIFLSDEIVEKILKRRSL